MNGGVKPVNNASDSLIPRAQNRSSRFWSRQPIMRIAIPAYSLPDRLWAHQVLPLLGIQDLIAVARSSKKLQAYVNAITDEQWKARAGLEFHAEHPISNGSAWRRTCETLHHYFGNSTTWSDVPVTDIYPLADVVAVRSEEGQIRALAAPGTTTPVYSIPDLQNTTVIPLSNNCLGMENTNPACSALEVIDCARGVKILSVKGVTAVCSMGQDEVAAVRVNAERRGGVIRRWNINTGEEFQSVPWVNEEGSRPRTITALGEAGPNRLVGTSQGNTFRLWDLSDGTVTKPLRYNHSVGGLPARYYYDINRIANLGDRLGFRQDGDEVREVTSRMHINTLEGEPLSTLYGLNYLSTFNDACRWTATTIAAIGYHQVLTWKVDDRGDVNPSILSTFPSPVKNLCRLPGGLLTACDRSEIRVWNQQGDQVASFSQSGPIRVMRLFQGKLALGGSQGVRVLGESAPQAVIVQPPPSIPQPRPRRRCNQTAAFVMICACAILMKLVCFGRR